MVLLQPMYKQNSKSRPKKKKGTPFIPHMLLVVKDFCTSQISAMYCTRIYPKMLFLKKNLMQKKRPRQNWKKVRNHCGNFRQSVLQNMRHEKACCERGFKISTKRNSRGYHPIPDKGSYVAKCSSTLQLARRLLTIKHPTCNQSSKRGN